jgi:YfiH family protein
MTMPIHPRLRLVRRGAFDYFSLDLGPEPGARFVVATRRGGVSFGQDDLNLSFNTGDDEAAVRENRARLHAAFGIGMGELAGLAQVHSAEIVRADGPAARGAEPIRADGMMTDRAGFWCRISIGDCQPVALYDARNRALAMLHAGWAGTAQRIVSVALERMRAEYGTKPRDVHAALGPCIRATAYQVDGRVFEELDRHGIDRASFVLDCRDGRGYLDIPAINSALLREAGVQPGQIADMGLCTHTLQSLFFSHRRDGLPGGRMFALGVIRQV